MTNWDTVSAAMLKAVALASNLDESRVIWKHQDIGAPDEEYVAIQISGVIPVGIDYVHQSYSAARPRGQEFKLEVRGVREVPLEIECFTAPAVSGLSGSALARCTSIVMGLQLPSVRHGLQIAGVGVFDPGPVQWIPDIPDVNFRGRAICTVRCYIPAPAVQEYVGFIERMSGQVTIQGGINGDVVDDFDTNAEVPGDAD